MLSRLWLSATPWTVARQAPMSVEVLQARILEWVALTFSRASSQTQGPNPGLPHCRQIIYQPNHQGSPRIREQVACPISRGSSRPRNQTRVSCGAGGFFIKWATWDQSELYKRLPLKPASSPPTSSQSTDWISYAIYTAVFQKLFNTWLCIYVSATLNPSHSPSPDMSISLLSMSVCPSLFPAHRFIGSIYLDSTYMS